MQKRQRWEREIVADRAGDIDWPDQSEVDQEELVEEGRERVRGRLLALLSTSYGLSIALHLVLVIVLAGILLTAPADERSVVVLQSLNRRVSEDPPDPELNFDVRRVPKIPLPKSEIMPVIPLVDSEPIPEPSKGELDLLTNKEQMAISVDDSHGIAGGGAGAHGTPLGTGRAKGRLSAPPAAQEGKQAALEWLARHQAADGRWESHGWQASCKEGGCLHRETYVCPEEKRSPTRRIGPCSKKRVGREVRSTVWERGGGGYDVGVTSLALLAFLGDGQSHRFGQFKGTVYRGLQWLKKQQLADGNTGFAGGESIYNHALATMALCEAYGVTRDFTLQGSAQRAVDFAVLAQNPGMGWRYGVKSGHNDSSVTGWFVLALKAARTADLRVPADVFQGAVAWYDRVTSSRGLTGYRTSGGGSSYIYSQKGHYDEVPTNTATSILCRVFTGKGIRDKAVKLGQQAVMKSLPRWPQGKSTRSVNFYYWYYGSYAMFQLGGKAWETWSEHMLEALHSQQRNGGGCERGSWDPVGEWCLVGGRVYATAISALTLETWYRYERRRQMPAR